VAEYEAFVRYLEEDVISKEGQEIKLIIRDTEKYLQRPVRAKIYQVRTRGMDKLWILDPLGRPRRPEPFGMKIIKEEDEEKLLDPEYQKARLKV
jgi:hypothetical protein